MKEQSHQRGKDYQRAVKQWLVARPLLGMLAETYGDAYDATHRGAVIGEESFDFSLALRKPLDPEACRILYAECKYRREHDGNVNALFGEFLDTVYHAAATAETADLERAEFVFISNVPPDRWRQFVNRRARFLRRQIVGSRGSCDNDLVGRLVEHVHILVISLTLARGRD